MPSELYILGETYLFTQAFLDFRFVLQSEPLIAATAIRFTKYQRAILITSNKLYILPPVW